MISESLTLDWGERGKKRRVWFRQQDRKCEERVGIEAGRHELFSSIYNPGKKRMKR